MCPSALIASSQRTNISQSAKHFINQLIKSGHGLYVAERKMSNWKDANMPPKAKEGWTHTRQVVLHYPSTSHKVECYGIGHYNFAPVHGGPHWTDYANFGRVPDRWCDIPE